MTKPVFERLDMRVILPNGMRGKPIVFYHDDLIDEVFGEMVADAEKIDAMFEVDGHVPAKWIVTGYFKECKK